MNLGFLVVNQRWGGGERETETDLEAEAEAAGFRVIAIGESGREKSRGEREMDLESDVIFGGYPQFDSI